MKDKILTWITSGSPYTRAKGLVAVFVALSLLAVISLFLLPTWVFLLIYSLTFSLALGGLLALTFALRMLENPMDAVENMMNTVNMDEVMALASSLFGSFPIKPSGPIGVVDNELSQK